MTALAHRPWGEEGPSVTFHDDVSDRDHDTIIEVLSQCDGAAFGPGTVHVEVLVGGANNRNYTATGSALKVAVRIANAASERLRVDRAAAAEAYQTAADEGVAPDFLTVILPEGHFATAFVEGRSLWFDTVQDAEVLPHIAATLRRTHAIAATSERRSDPFEDIENWVELAKQDGTVIPEDLDDLLSLTSRIRALVTHLRLPEVFCHNDVVPGNFIVEPDLTVKLVDWDYAALGSAAFELASFCNTAQLNTELRSLFLRAYNGGKRPTPAQLATLELLELVAAMRELSWVLMAAPILQGETDLPEDLTYESYRDMVLGAARAIASRGDLDGLFAAASIREERAW